MRALLLAPVPRLAVFLGKAISIAALVLAVAVVVAPLLALFLNAPLFQHPGPFVLVVVLGIVGFAVIGTVFAATLLKVRSRDVLEHVERVLAHVRRLGESAEAAVQMHFSALGHRTNDIMRTLTVLTAIFLPLNLITGFFGMNFDAMPLIHSATGIWVALGVMGMIGVGLAAFFWRRRYIGRS